MPRILPSIKIAILVAAAVGGLYGYRYIEKQRLLARPLATILPGRFTMLGLEEDSGYSIIIAGETAYIREGRVEGTFSSSSDAQAGQRVPTADLLEAKAGDLQSVGRLVTKMNDLIPDPEKTPQLPKLWSQGDIEKALSGDKKLRTQLSEDLGSPLSPGEAMPRLTLAAIDNGIVVRVLVPVTLDMPEGMTTVLGPVDRLYQPQAARELAMKTESKPLPPAAAIKLYQKLLAGSKGNVAQELRNLYTPATLKMYAEKPQDLLSKTCVVLTEKFVNGASMTEAPPDPLQTRSTYSLSLDLTDEGRARLYRYSAEHGGKRILVIYDGAALTASNLTPYLNVSSFDVTRLRDRRIVTDVVNLINGNGKTVER